MAGKQIPVYLFLLLATFSVSFSAPLHYQTLHLTSLPKPPETQTLSWPTQFPDSESVSETNLALPLLHVDHLSSTPKSTPESLFKNRLRRDAFRVKTLSAGRPQSGNFGSRVVSGASLGSGEYFTRIGVGTPAKNFYMILDTGSDIVWLQCLPCLKCYIQTDPIFNPNISTSFQSVPCTSPLCNQLDRPGCNSSRKICQYRVSYGDGSFTTGDLTTETLTFGRKNIVPNIAVGCGHTNKGLFNAAAGLLGLGRGKLGFPVQASGEKFSYCLVEPSVSIKKSSYLLFGESAVPKKAAFTRLLTNPKVNTFYYVGLEGFSVGGTRVRGINPSLFKIDGYGYGGVIVDSGTSVTRLTQSAYVALRNAFRAGATNLKNTSSDISLFDTCFDLSGLTSVSVPTVAFHFDGVDVSLPSTNYLIPVDNEGTVCFAFAGTTDGLSIIGNIQQQGFRVVFDLAGQKLGFVPQSC
ncbi:hypothetical protein CASFOL_031535 [Castilleja foliolosa]|uniref:Peptidase A1 domain-containing protein n=1 Tax=Castilleja foliolosa TaxID=1961234 RepID=A0ABD3C5N2_9LAMI